MQITKCDICKKRIKEYTEKIHVNIGFFSGSFEICKSCGKPILKLLKSKKLLKEDKSNKK